MKLADRGDREEDQQLRRKVLQELQALVCCSEDDVSDNVTDTEWFYLVSMSYSFPQGVGIPGQALATAQHVWLVEANKASEHISIRAHVAKMAGIQDRDIIMMHPTVDQSLVSLHSRIIWNPL